MEDRKLGGGRLPRTIQVVNCAIGNMTITGTWDYMQLCTSVNVHEVYKCFTG